MLNPYERCALVYPEGKPKGSRAASTIERNLTL
jgi:hypothetical protein